MNRADFMKNLSELLADVPPTEREEAIQYYNDYFDDAGEENEQSVIASLGTPQQLADTIRAGLADGGNSGEFTEKGFSGYEPKKSNEVMNLNNADENGGSSNQNSYNGQNNSSSHGYYSNQNTYDNQSYNNNQGYNSNQSYNNNQNSYNSRNTYDKQGGTAAKPYKKQMSSGTIVLIVILCILASPILLGVGGGLLGAVIGIFGGLFGIVIGFGAAAVALIAVGVCLFVYGIVLTFGIPLAGLCLIGAGMICMAIGLFCLWLTVLVCGGLIPVIAKGIAKLFNSIFNKGGR
ncbi:MAG: DUF1700 domain-containing protein [Lachnospiraceae bacterium]|nr:DUF1700 domain-containing protein [Lachnospiraceae bacterium]